MHRLSSLRYLGLLTIYLFCVESIVAFHPIDTIIHLKDILKIRVQNIIKSWKMSFECFKILTINFSFWILEYFGSLFKPASIKIVLIIYCNKNRHELHAKIYSHQHFSSRSQRPHFPNHCFIALPSRTRCLVQGNRRTWVSGCKVLWVRGKGARGCYGSCSQAWFIVKT